MLEIVTSLNKRKIKLTKSNIKKQIEEAEMKRWPSSLFDFRAIYSCFNLILPNGLI